MKRRPTTPPTSPPHVSPRSHRASPLSPREPRPSSATTDSAPRSTRPWPFPARTGGRSSRRASRLAYGERLRRAKAPGEARPHLILAADTFQRLGATPWTARAQSELRATGRITPGAAGTTEPLNPQESEIARLAASGLTNREIGERLFLSPRTIAAHLYRVFPKLGIASRSALRDALDQNSPSVR